MKHLQLSTLAMMLAWAPMIGSSAMAATLQAGQSIAVYGGASGQFNIGLAGGRADMVLSDGQMDLATAETTMGGYLAVLNMARVDVSAVGDAATAAQLQSIPDWDKPLRVGIRAVNTVNGISVDDQTGALRTIGTTGGMQLDAPSVVGLSRGGMLQISNWQFDLEAQTVSADLYGVSAPYVWAGELVEGVTYDRLSTMSWSFGTMSGLRNLNDLTSAELPEGVERVVIDGEQLFKLTHTFRALDTAPTFDDTLLSSLGLSSDAIRAAYGAVNADPEGFGWVTTTTYLAMPLTAGAAVNTLAAIPEPSTYALMGLGLVGVMLARRQASRH